MQTIPDRNMKFIDLFAGIGGFRIGLENNGHTCVWSNDYDKDAQKIYKQHFGEIDGRDIRTIKSYEIPKHDILCGGFPCPDFSIAGKRAGFGGKQGDLFFEVLRILRDKRSPYFILENVRGLLNHNKGQTFKTIIDELGKLGYEVQWFLCDSQNFGAAQQRKRVIIVGNLGDKQRPKILCERQGYKRHDSPKSEMGTRGLCLTTRSGQRQDPTAESFIGYCLTRKDRGVGNIWNETYIAGVDTNGERSHARISKKLDVTRGRLLGNAVTTNVITEIVKHLLK